MADGPSYSYYIHIAQEFLLFLFCFCVWNMRERQSSDSRRRCIRWASVTLPGGGLDLHVNEKERQLHPRMANLKGDISGKYLCSSIPGTSPTVEFMQMISVGQVRSHSLGDP